MPVLTLALSLVMAVGSSSDASKLPDVPIPGYDVDRYVLENRTPLRRTHDLFRAFLAGEGEIRWKSGQLGTHTARDDLLLTPLPWRVDASRRNMAYHISWKPHDIRNDTSSLDSESLLGFVLDDGRSWCTPEIALEPGSRLRFEAVPVSGERNIRLDLIMESSDGAHHLLEKSPLVHANLSAEAQIDLALEDREGRICFRAGRGRVGIGEARLLAPEIPGSDPRPRWVVLAIVDALRADVLEREEAARVLPTIKGLADKGHWYRKAVSPGCHTRAAVWPILMGRDLMRIDPLRRRRQSPVDSPLTRVYSRGNLFVSHLAEEAGYHTVFLGNNGYFRLVPAFSRYSNQGDVTTGTFDTVELLPELMKRYHDERIMLVYYVSTPHGSSRTPRRLYEELGCGEITGLGRYRCMYDARIRHADESVAALQTALSQSELTQGAMLIVTSDHGELFGDGFPLEGETVSFRDGTFMGSWEPLDESHGAACHWNEIHVPLILAGPPFAPATWDGPVSTLDIVPSLGELLNLSMASAMDGEVLPLVKREGPGESDRRFVSYGYCVDSIIQQDRQLLWWLGKCRIRSKETKAPLTRQTEQWRISSPIAREEPDPEKLKSRMTRHETWLRSRLPSGAHVIDFSDISSGRLILRVDEGEIVDYGPSSTVHGLEGIHGVSVSSGNHSMAIDFERYDGLFYVATSPPLTPIVIDLELPPRPSDPLLFIGPMQLPLDALGQTLDPRENSPLFVSADSPAPRVSRRPGIRYWWQPYAEAFSGERDDRRNLDFDRVLREWGYIR